MKQDYKIPVVVSVTGHRNVVAADVAELKRQISETLEDIKTLCKDTPVVMMCGMAQGADMLCVEAAFEAEIPVYAVLPCAREKFIDSFDFQPDKDKLYPYLDKCARIIQIEDVEYSLEWFANESGMDADSYGYRQVGVYLANHAHITIALWDGKAPKSDFGCGTVEVIDFALSHNYFNKDRVFRAGEARDSAVVWIKTNRDAQDGGYVSDSPQREWLVSPQEERSVEKYYQRYDSSSLPPDFLLDMIAETSEYNAAQCASDEWCHLWENADELDDYRKNLREHFVKADKLSYAVNQPKYKRFMLTFAVLGALIALFFLIYDDASLPWTIIPCTVLVVVLILLSVRCNKRAYHAKYIKYRAFAEALRIQFYTSLCLDETENISNVCDLYSWSQKVKFVWVRKAIYAIDVISGRQQLNRTSEFLNRVRESWVGYGKNPEGQLRYHSRKKSVNLKEVKKLNIASQVFTWSTVAMYCLIFILEAVSFFTGLSGKVFFWEGTSFVGLSYRNIGAILLGTLAATSLLMSSFWGKLSFDRLYDDNDKMIKLYQSAYSRWYNAFDAGKRPYREFENFVKEIAREEIVENGIWCSYVEENTLDINL